jgi:anaerobic dimethyl sulfoxide reductase subunit B (iron-sulfur subunit)
MTERTGTGRGIVFYVDTTRCINCRTCEVACKDANGAGPGVRIRRVRVFEGGVFPKVYAYNVSMSCNHCQEPACLAKCPAGAYSRRAEDGLVVHDPARCIGCRYCTWACPYGAPQYDARSGRIVKCNMCLGKAAEGEPPACVASCPMRAIEVASFEEISSRAGATISIRDLPPPSLTRPRSRYKVRPEAEPEHEEG